MGTELEEGDIIDDLSSLARLRPGATRSISAENPDGAVGGGGRATEGTGAHAARDLGQGWKVSPSTVVFGTTGGSAPCVAT